MRKKLSKYIAAFYYFYKALIVLSATRGRISIISFASDIGVFAGIASASSTPSISLDYRNNKESIRNNKK